MLCSTSLDRQQQAKRPSPLTGNRIPEVDGGVEADGVPRDIEVLERAATRGDPVRQRLGPRVELRPDVVDTFLSHGTGHGIPKNGCRGKSLDDKKRSCR